MSEREQSLEERHFKISLRYAVTFLVFLFSTVAAAAAWAQNVTNHLSNLDNTMVDVRDTLKKLQDLNVLQERTARMEERLTRLEDWRLQRPSTQFPR